MLEGSLYPALQRLEGGGVVTSTLITVDGRRRRVYRISRAGRRAAASSVQDWFRFSAAVDRVMGVRA